MVHLGEIQRAKVASRRATPFSSPIAQARQSAATTFRAMTPGQREASPPRPQLRFMGYHRLWKSRAAAP